MSKAEKAEKRPDPHDPKTWSTPRPKSPARHVEGWLAELADLTSKMTPTYHYREYVPKTIWAWVENYEERAAILEYTGGFTRAEAERLAREMNGPEPKS